MKRLILITTVLFFFLSSFSQNKKIEKIEKLYTAGNYEKCIAKAKEYNFENKKDATTYFYIFLSFLKEYEIYKDHFSVKMAAKNLEKGLTKENSKESKISH